MRAMKWVQRIFCSLMMVLALMAIQPAVAQEFRATLTGRVTDVSGAVMVKASVKAVNNATQQTYEGITSRNGDYYIPYVLPGTYTVSVSAEGFKTEVQGNVLIEASGYRGVSFVLQ